MPDVTGVRVKRSAILAAAAAALLLSAPAAQARLSVDPNWRMGTDLTPGRGKDSVGLAVDPRNPRHIAEVNADWFAGQCEHHVSFDGGRTWRGRAFTAPAGFGPVPCTVGPHLAEHMQAGIAYGSGRNVYATFASPKQLGDGLTEAKSLFVAISRDGGRTFGEGRIVAPGGPTPSQGPHYILPTIGVEPAAKGGPRHDVVYVAAGDNEQSHEGSSSENIRMVVSSDAGRTWGTPFNVNTPNENAIEQSRPVIGRRGAVYISWRDRGRGATPGTFMPEGTVIVAKSRDHGATWNRVTIAHVRGYVYTGPPVPPFQQGGTFTGSTFPRIAADPRRNSVYVVYGQGKQVPPEKAQTADHFISPDQHVYFQASRNGGRTWTDPQQINSEPPIETEIAQTRHPWVSVAPNGRVDVVWQDRRHWYRGCTNTHVACQEARLGDTYYAYSKNQGRTWSRNYRLTDRSTNNDVGFDYRFGTYWAYGPVAVSTGRNTLLVGWMDSRKGNPDTDSQDIYLTRVRVNASGPVPVRRIPRRSPASLAVSLSRRAYPGGGEAVLASTFASRPWTRVVIVNERDLAGVLAAGVLARANLGPVLLAPSSGLPAAAKAEVSRLAPIGAYVIGSPGALSPQVESDLVAAGVPQGQIVRFFGADAAGTASQIATAADRRSQADKRAGTPAFDAAIIANPASRDAFAAAVLAANRRLPVLYVSRDAVPQSTADALKALAIKQTLVIGGTGAVGDAVLAQLPAPRRLGGADQFATSRAVLRESLLRGLPANLVYVTDGTRSMESALLGATVGRIGGLQLVARGGAAGALRTIARSRSLRASVTGVLAIARR